MDVIMPFGKYTGRPIEQVALLDYPYLTWAQTLMRSQRLFYETERVIKILDGYTPRVNCILCGDIAYNLFSTLIRNIERGETYDIEWDFYCNKEECLSLANDRKKEYRMHHRDKGLSSINSIKFSIITSFPKNPKWIRKKLQEILLETTGFIGKRTKDNCISLLRKLEEINDKKTILLSFK